MGFRILILLLAAFHVSCFEDCDQDFFLGRDKFVEEKIYEVSRLVRAAKTKTEMGIEEDVFLAYQNRFGERVGVNFRWRHAEVGCNNLELIWSDDGGGIIIVMHAYLLESGEVGLKYVKFEQY